jgi:FdhE protein
MSSEVIRDGSAAGQIPQVPQFRPVAASVFAERAARLDTLAPGHGFEAFLRFVAALARAQDAVLGTFPAVPLPDAAHLERCKAHGLPALSVDGHQRDRAWRDGLIALLAQIDRERLPVAGHAVIGRLRQMPAGELESIASRLLSGAYTEVDAGQAPFIAAALQVYWVFMARALGADAFSSDVHYGQCPVCGSHPVASVVRIGGAAQGLRYVVCSLCGSERHVVRVKCTACASTAGIAYLGIEGASDAVKAETCDQCKTYLKIGYLEKDTALDPTADDLATLALDLLIDEQGYNRIGPNLMFWPGAGAVAE